VIGVFYIFIELQKNYSDITHKKMTKIIREYLDVLTIETDRLLALILFNTFVAIFRRLPEIFILLLIIFWLQMTNTLALVKTSENFKFLKKDDNFMHQWILKKVEQTLKDGEKNRKEPQDIIIDAVFRVARLGNMPFLILIYLMVNMLYGLFAGWLVAQKNNLQDAALTKLLEDPGESFKTNAWKNRESFLSGLEDKKKKNIKDIFKLTVIIKIIPRIFLFVFLLIFFYEIRLVLFFICSLIVNQTGGVVGSITFFAALLLIIIIFIKKLSSIAGEFSSFIEKKISSGYTQNKLKSLKEQLKHFSKKRPNKYDHSYGSGRFVGLQVAAGTNITSHGNTISIDKKLNLLPGVFMVTGNNQRTILEFLGGKIAQLSDFQNQPHTFCIGNYFLRFERDDECYFTDVRQMLSKFFYVSQMDRPHFPSFKGNVGMAKKTFESKFSLISDALNIKSIPNESAALSGGEGDRLKICRAIVDIDTGEISIVILENIVSSFSKDMARRLFKLLFLLCQRYGVIIIITDQSGNLENFRRENPGMVGLITTKPIGENRSQMVVQTSEN
jgi:hypothetical protein